MKKLLKIFDWKSIGILIIYFILLFAAFFLSLDATAQNNVTAKLFSSYNADSATVKATVAYQQTIYGNVGGIYYNKQSSKWRVYQDSTWVDLFTPDSGGDFWPLSGTGTFTNNVIISAGTHNLSFASNSSDLNFGDGLDNFDNITFYTNSTFTVVSNDTDFTSVGNISLISSNSSVYNADQSNGIGVDDTSIQIVTSGTDPINIESDDDINITSAGNLNLTNTNAGLNLVSSGVFGDINIEQNGGADINLIATNILSFADNGTYATSPIADPGEKTFMFIGDDGFGSPAISTGYNNTVGSIDHQINITEDLISIGYDLSGSTPGTIEFNSTGITATGKDNELILNSSGVNINLDDAGDVLTITQSVGGTSVVSIFEGEIQIDDISGSDELALNDQSIQFTGTASPSITNTSGIVILDNVTYTSTTDVPFVAPGPTTLYTFSLPAATITADRQSIVIEIWYDLAANTNVKTLSVTIGGTTVAGTGTMNLATQTAGKLTTTVSRTSATAGEWLQESIIAGTSSNAGTIDLASGTGAAITWANANTVNIVATGTTNNDVIGMNVKVYIQSE